jgi:hypothetical protein
MPWHTTKLRSASTPRNRTKAPTLCGEIRSATGEGSEAGRGGFKGTEPGSHRVEVHLHAGGQGFWVARLAKRLRADVVLCCALGGEPERV